MSFPSRDVETLLQEASSYANIELIRSGTIPSHQVAMHIRNIVDVLSDVSDSASIQDRTIDPAQTANVQEAIFICRATVAAIRRVPPELFASIFTMALPDYWSSLDIEETLNFAHTCYYWRRIALGMPQLWTHLCITLQTRTDPLAHRLQWSGNQPLHISIADKYPWENTAPNTETLRLVFMHSDRWSNVSLSNFHKMVGHLESFWPAEFPALKVLKMDVGEEHTKCFRYFEKAAPHVVSLELTFDHPWEPLVLPTAWNLVNLDLCFDHDEGRLALIMAPLAACAHSLVRLVLWITEIGDVEEQYKAICFPSLKDLSLTYGAIHLCRHAEAPMLAQVKLYGQPIRRWEESYMDSLHILLRRSQKCGEGMISLERLELENMTTTAYDTVVACLRLLPGLRSLKIEEEGESDDDREPLHSAILVTFLRAMTRRIDPTGDPSAIWVLPSLTRLEMKYGGVADADLRAMMADMILSRWTVCGADGERPWRLDSINTNIPLF